MSYGGFRSSTGDLHYHDEPPRRPERWDRDKFERYSRRSPDGRDSLRYEERDRFGGGRNVRDVEFEEHLERRAPRSRVQEREREHDRYYEEDRFSRRRPDFLNEPTPSEIANKALAPYRRKSIVERDFEGPGPLARPARPQFIRRQSSLDTFDRRPLPRYSDREREEWRPPTNTPIPLPIRHRSPSRPRRYVEDFEEIRHRELEPDVREEEYRDVRVRREKSRSRKSKSRRGSPSAKSSTSSFEEVSPVREVGKKGKTRMPRRLVQKQAVIDLGYPFEEEEDFIVVKRALEKEQIDEIIKISEGYKDTKVTYKYEEVREIEPPPMHMEHLPPAPLAPPTIIDMPPPPPSTHGGHGGHGGPSQYAPSHHAPSVHHAPTVMHAPPPMQYAPSMHHAPSHHAPSHHAPSHYAKSVRSESPTRTLFEERIEESNTIAGPLTVLAPPRSERDIKHEIRALEAERRLIRLERESDYEVIERREPKREVIRVEKDRKVVRRREPDGKILGAMMATLT